MILRLARQLLAGMTVIRGSRATAAGEGARSTLHLRHLWVAELVPGFFVFVVLGVFQVGGEGYVDLVV